jgi:hypothetical protein
MAALARLGRRGAMRIEWVVLDWNERDPLLSPDRRRPAAGLDPYSPVEDAMRRLAESESG